METQSFLFNLKVLTAGNDDDVNSALMMRVSSIEKSKIERTFSSLTKHQRSMFSTASQLDHEIQRRVCLIFFRSLCLSRARSLSFFLTVQSMEFMNTSKFFHTDFFPPQNSCRHILRSLGSRSHQTWNWIFQPFLWWLAWEILITNLLRIGWINLRSVLALNLVTRLAVNCCCSQRFCHWQTITRVSDKNFAK